MTNEEHLAAVKEQVAKIARSLNGVPTSVGIDALLTLSAVMISATAVTKDEAANRVVEAGAKLVSHVMRNYDHERAEYVAANKGRLQ